MIVKRNNNGLRGKGNGTEKNVYTYGHFYNYYDEDLYGYIISLNRLWCDEKNHIHNNFGQIQFMRYSREFEQINFDKDGKFKMMYPHSGDDFDYNVDSDTGHIVCNPPLSIMDPDIFNKESEKYDEKKIKKIADCFKDFINVELNNKEKNLDTLLNYWK